MILIITGVSASGKTTLQNKLLANGWTRPLNFTTREPRNDNAFDVDDDGDFKSKELDEYVFINNKNYATKFSEGDFICGTSYGGNMYGISKHLPKGNNCIILDPIGREQFRLKEILGDFKGEKIVYVYLNIDEQEQEKRLEGRGDSVDEIRRRKNDFLWFRPSNESYILDGTKPIEDNYNVLCEILKKT